MGAPNDLDMVDYLEDPLEGVSFWATLDVTLKGLLLYCCNLSDTIATMPSISGPSCLTVTLSEPLPSWLATSIAPPSPSSLNFITSCINPNIEDVSLGYPPPPSSAGSHNPLPDISSNSEQEPSSSTPLSNSYTNIPTLSDAFLSELPLTPEHPQENPTLSKGR